MQLMVVVVKYRLDDLFQKSRLVESEVPENGSPATADPCDGRSYITSGSSGFVCDRPMSVYTVCNDALDTTESINQLHQAL